MSGFVIEDSKIHNYYKYLPLYSLFFPQNTKYVEVPTSTQFKGLVVVQFFFMFYVSYAHQDCIYLIKNTIIL